MAKCVVIGGGFAGLASSAFLSKNNIPVLLLEASPKLGGRAYSFKHKRQKNFIDNGQHILMGCYSNTLELLELINARRNFFFQDKLNLTLRNHSAQEFSLNASRGFYPVNLLMAILKFDAFDYPDKLKIIKFFTGLIFDKNKKLTGMTVSQMLKERKQSDKIIKMLWEILTVGALNTDIHSASASLFNKVLKEVFFKGNFASKIIIPKSDLTNAYVIPAKKYIEEKGGEIIQPENVKEFITYNNKIVALKTGRRTINDFDCVISAIPFFALTKIKNNPLQITLDKSKIKYSPILSVHLWLKKNNFNKQFYGLIESPIHWLFNHGKFITLVTSNAKEFLQTPKEKIFNEFLDEISNFFPEFDKNEVFDYQVIIEKRATFIPTNEYEKERQKIRSQFSNLFLAGDWVNTGLPSTIESAVKSGKIAAGNAVNWIRKH